MTGFKSPSGREWGGLLLVPKTPANNRLVLAVVFLL